MSISEKTKNPNRDGFFKKRLFLKLLFIGITSILLFTVVTVVLFFYLFPFSAADNTCHKEIPNFIQQDLDAMNFNGVHNIKCEWDSWLDHNYCLEAVLEKDEFDTVLDKHLINNSSKELNPDDKQFFQTLSCDSFFGFNPKDIENLYSYSDYSSLSSDSLHYWYYEGKLYIIAYSV